MYNFRRRHESEEQTPEVRPTRRSRRHESEEETPDVRSTRRRGRPAINKVVDQSEDDEDEG